MNKKKYKHNRLLVDGRSERRIPHIFQPVLCNVVHVNMCVMHWFRSSTEQVKQEKLSRF